MTASRWPVLVDPFTGCWIYSRGKPNSSGYATHWTKTGPHPAHVFVYQAEVGPVPEGKVLDHWCRRRPCCAPAHLEPVSRNENERRKLWSHRIKLLVCPNGHDLKEHGRRTVPENGIVCRVCSGVWSPPAQEPELI